MIEPSDRSEKEKILVGKGRGKSLTSLTPYSENNVREMKQIWPFRCCLEKINIKMFSFLVILAPYWIFQTQLTQIYPFKPQTQQYQGHAKDTLETSTEISF